MVAVMDIQIGTKLSPLAEWLKRYLTTSCKGEANVRKRATILSNANQDWFAITHIAVSGVFTDEELRLAKEELLDVYSVDHAKGLLVCSGPKGWWAASNTKETDAAASFLEHRAFDLLDKANVLRRGGYDEFGPQTVML